MTLPIAKSTYDALLEQMGISDISCATIRQAGAIARALESQSQTEFLHLEMGVPGLPPEKIGVEAEKRALDAGVAYVAGEFFHPDGSGKNTMRMNFSFMTRERIAEGVKLLARLLKETLRSA